MAKEYNLVILQPLRIKLLPNGEVLLTRKLIEAVVQLKDFWPGSITVLMEPTNQEHDNVDKRIFKLSDLPFALEIVNFDKLTPAYFQSKASVVLAAISGRQNHISKLCKAAGVPCIYVSEYTLKTRKQIVAVSTQNPVIRLRRHLWEQEQERKQRAAISLADGLQCNGTPTYEAYRSLNRNPLLFYDTRITQDMLATEEDIENRGRDRSADKPLRLLFSGRLIKMKGADHLLDVAEALKGLKVPFHLYISGAGLLEAEMNQRIATNQLSDCVTMMGLPDFKTEFFPFVKKNIDLFVCCHRQGDPSCTYIETMSCGVPVIGYDNEAFAGIVAHSQAGWLVPMDRPQVLAQKIAELHRDRASIRAMSHTSLQFARKHTFEETFAARVYHMKNVMASFRQSQVVVSKPNLEPGTGCSQKVPI